MLKLSFKGIRIEFREPSKTSVGFLKVLINNKVLQYTISSQMLRRWVDR
jgi:predicted solute-binding protein